MPRTEISNDGRYRRFEVRDDAGNVIGWDEETIPNTEEANAFTLRDRARTALAANATFLALASPTNAQTVAQVQRLTRECSALIRLLTSALDTTDGT